MGSGIWLPSTRLAQPRTCVGVNWSNPIAQGIGGLFDTRAGVELVNNVAATNLTNSFALSGGGVAADFSSTANQQYPHRPSYACLGPLTIFALVEIRSFSNYTCIISKDNTTTTSVPYEYRFGFAASSGSEQTLIRANSNFKQFYSNSSQTPTGVGYPTSIAVTCPSADIGITPNFWAKGNAISVSGGAGSASGLATDAGANVWIGRRYDGVCQLDGRIYFVAVWNRCLSAAELVSLNLNPWQLFEDEQIFIPTSSGTLYPTLSNIRFAPATPTGGTFAVDLS